MAGVLDNVNQRTTLVGENRLELLLFRLKGRQLYGINVFKVKEVLPCPPLSAIPGHNRVVRGVAHICGGTLSILDMNLAIGKQPLEDVAKFSPDELAHQVNDRVKAITGETLIDPEGEQV